MWTLIYSLVITVASHALGSEPLATGIDPPQKVTTLSRPDIVFTRPSEHYVIMKRGPIQAIVVDNHAVNTPDLRDHRAGYSGVASLSHTNRRDNLFVPHYAGLNFEHIHDGTNRDRNILFEPRKATMELRVVDEHTCELYQPPTPNWKLESCQRYNLLSDGTIEMTIEVIPRERSFKNNYIGLFWASYIHQPESGSIHFRGHSKNSRASSSSWITATSPAHGKLSTHTFSTDDRQFKHDSDFPLTLVFNQSKFNYSKPWYYGLSHEMAYTLIFRPDDQVRFSQSPSGGGAGNPAWDFQFFISDYETGKVYRKVLRVHYGPFESAEKLESATRQHRSWRN